MKYYIDQSFDLPWSNYDILKEDGGIAFKVETEATLGHELEVYNCDGQCVGRIVEQLAAVPTYLVWENGVQCGKIIRKLAFPKPKLVVDYKDWIIERKVGFSHIEVKDKKKNPVAVINREKWRMTDHFVLDVEHEEDVITVVLLMLVVSAFREEANAATLFSALI